MKKEVEPLRTLIDIDDDILEEAMKIAGTHTKKETVKVALEELIKARLRHKLREMAGSGAVVMSHAELIKLRHKRDRQQKSLLSKT
jgi:Arc/MetJ family transcription regulator